MGIEQTPGGESPSQMGDAASHARAMALLPEYVMLRVLGGIAVAEWQSLERHLAQCPICREEADAIERLMRASYTGAIPAVDPPPPDLSFLASRGPDRPSSLRLTRPPANASEQQTSARISIPFSPALLRQAQTRIVARSGAARLRYSHTIAPATPGEPHITIEVLSPDERPEIGTVRVCVELPDRSPFDQAGTRVEVLAGELELYAVTDQSGNVVFNDIPLGSIDRWQISIDPPASAQSA